MCIICSVPVAANWPPKSLVAAFIGWNLPRLGEVPVRTQKLDMVADGMYLTWFSGPDGGRLAYVADGGVWVHDLDGVEARRVADVDDRTSVFWSPDGEHIGFPSPRSRRPHREGAHILPGWACPWGHPEGCGPAV